MPQIRSWLSCCMFGPVHSVMINNRGRTQTHNSTLLFVTFDVIHFKVIFIVTR